MKNRLEEIREQKSVTQEELARQLEVSPHTINSIETGQYNPSIILAFKLARFFGVSIEEIFVFEKDLKRDYTKAKRVPAMFIIAGIILVIAGLIFDFNNILGDKVPWFMICSGTPLFFIGCRDFWNAYKYPGTFKDIEVERHDERNVQIRNKVGNITFIVTLFAFLGLALVFKELGYELPSKLMFGFAGLSLFVCLVLGWYHKKKS